MNKEQRKKYNLEWRIKNKAKIAEYKQTYRKVNSQKIAAYQKIYRELNKETLCKKRLQEKITNGWIRQKKEAGISYRTWLDRIIKRDGKKCRKCGTSESLTLNHKIPRCIGGEYSYENLEILCRVCNIKDYHSLVKKALKSYFNIL